VPPPPKPPSVPVVLLPLDPPVKNGDHYFTLDDFRAETDLDDVEATDEDVTRNRDLAEEVIEHATGIAWLPRRGSEMVRSASGRVRLGRSAARDLEGLVYGTTTLDAAGLVGQGVWTDGRWLLGYVGEVPATLTYTYGFETPPLRIRRAAMTAARIWTLRGPVDDRATQIAADGATINLSTPGLQGSITGIPEVDATIRAYRNPATLQ
jgi:hypothetical protein